MDDIIIKSVYMSENMKTMHDNLKIETGEKTTNSENLLSLA